MKSLLTYQRNLHRPRTFPIWEDETMSTPSLVEVPRWFPIRCHGRYLPRVCTSRSLRHRNFPIHLLLFSICFPNSSSSLSHPPPLSPQVTHWYTLKCTTKSSISGAGWLAGDVYTKHDQVETTATIWSPCGATGLLNVNNRIALTSTTTAGTGEVSNDDATVAFTQQAHVSWRQCVP
jgi:hypothetical protein